MSHSSLIVPYPPQVAAVEEVVAIYTETTCRYVLLSAPMQSGKTGAYLSVAEQMLRRGCVDAVYVVCGSHEIELRDQCRADVAPFETEFPGQVHAVFRQDCERTTMPGERVLIINDESHLDCKKSQTLDVFLGRHGLSMAGTTAEMIAHDIYILSVDATPFAEEAAIVHAQSLPKRVVELRPGPLYYGPFEYHADGLVHPTFPIVGAGAGASGIRKFIALVQEPRFARKFILLRIQETRQEVAMAPLLDAITRAGIPLLRYTSKYTGRTQQLALTVHHAEELRRVHGIRVACLEREPATTTLVFIDGRLRCGKRLPKRHIGFVWEAASDKTTIDILLQSLVGRMSGYLGHGPYHVPLDVDARPMIYLPPHIFATHDDKSAPWSEWERVELRRIKGGLVIGPRNATNVSPAPLRKAIPRVPCAPIRFSLDPAFVADRLARASMREVKEEALRVFQENRAAWVDASDRFTDAQKLEIQKELLGRSATKCHIRQFRGSSNRAFYGPYMDAATRGEATEDPMKDCPFLTFCVVYPDFVHPTRDDVVPGTVLACIYTVADGIFTVKHTRKARVSEVSDETHFTPHAADDDDLDNDVGDQKENPIDHGDQKENVVATMPPAGFLGAAYGFSAEIATRPSLFRQTLMHYLQMTQGPGTFSTNFRGLSIPLSKRVYDEVMLAEMCAYVLQVCGVDVHLSVVEHDETIELRRIWW